MSLSLRAPSPPWGCAVAPLSPCHPVTPIPAHCCTPPWDVSHPRDLAFRGSPSPHSPPHMRAPRHPVTPSPHSQPPGCPVPVPGNARARPPTQLWGVPCTPQQGLSRAPRLPPGCFSPLGVCAGPCGACGGSVARPAPGCVGLCLGSARLEASSVPKRGSPEWIFPYVRGPRWLAGLAAAPPPRFRSSTCDRSSGETSKERCFAPLGLLGCVTAPRVPRSLPVGQVSSANSGG